MQMAVSIYRTFDSYPLLIQHELRAGPCQSNSPPSPHNNTNVFPLRTVQLIKGRFVWRRICGSQENAGRGFSHFSGAGLGRIGKLFACTLQIFIKNNAKKWENAHSKWLGSGLDQLPWQLRIASTWAAAEWKAQHHCLWIDGAVCWAGFERPSTPQWDSSIYILATQFINNGWACRSPAPCASTCHKWLNDDTIKQS